MNGGPDECVRPGECPLCLSGVASPTAAVGVLPILAHHFATDCLVTDFAGSGHA